MTREQWANTWLAIRAIMEAFGWSMMLLALIYLWTIVRGG